MKCLGMIGKLNLLTGRTKGYKLETLLLFIPVWVQLLT